jgi:hypothetical protein
LIETEVGSVVVRDLLLEELIHLTLLENRLALRAVAFIDIQQRFVEFIHIKIELDQLLMVFG